MRGKQTGSNDKPYSTIVLVAILVISLVILSSVTHSSDNNLHKQLSSSNVDSNGSIQRSSSKAAATKTRTIPLPPTQSKSSPKEPSVVILLQQSPVDQSHQLDRLHGIDGSWAKWTSSNQYYHTHIYASLPMSANKQQRNFNLIHPFAHNFSESIRVTPYHNLIGNLITVSFEQPDYQWLILANDHSYMVIPNLLCYLAKMNPNRGIYSGNRLQRGLYHNYPLYFASGGAGIVFSKVSIRLFLLTLARMRSRVIRETIDMICAHDDYQTPAHTELQSCCRHSFDFPLVIDADKMNIICVLRQMIQWMRADFSNSRSITFKLSIQQDLKLTVAENLLTTEYRDNRGLKNITTHSTTDKELLRFCDAVNDNENANPALVMAYCLQSYYQIPFLPSTTATNKERFNVYGIVRTLYGDFDSWYPEAKYAFEDPISKKLQLANMIAEDVISFHYTSQTETNLLYKIMTNDMPLKTSSELRDLWIKNDFDAGHYSRWRFHDEKEIDNLYQFLTQQLTVKKYPQCQ